MPDNDDDHKPAPKPPVRPATNKREHKPRAVGHPWAVDKVHEGPPQGLSITAPPLGGDKGTQHK